MPVRVLIADDHPLFRDGLRNLVQQTPDLELVGEATTTDEALDLTREKEPSVVVLDLSMPSSNEDANPSGLSVIQPLVEAGSNVLVLTMHDESLLLGKALGEGALGFLVKHAAADEILTAIRAVSRGHTHVHATLTPKASPERIAIPLSGREKQVLTLIALGHTNAEAADLLGISVKTVEGYRARLMKKLQISKRVELVRAAMELGMLQPANQAESP